MMTNSGSFLIHEKLQISNMLPKVHDNWDLILSDNWLLFLYYFQCVISTFHFKKIVIMTRMGGGGCDNSSILFISCACVHMVDSLWINWLIRGWLFSTFVTSSIRLCDI